MPDLRPWPAVLLAGLLLLATACEDDRPEPAPEPATSTPLAEVATGTIAVARVDLCPRIAPAAVEEALGSAPTTSERWANGERARLAPGVTDVAHEFGCRWTAGGTTARAWVFAPPVTPGRAELLRRAAGRAPGCEPVPDAPRFGSRDVAVRCSEDDREVTAFHGLFGDAWLSCSLETTHAAPDLLDRTGRWCVAALQAGAA